MFWIDIIILIVALLLIYKSYQQGLLNGAVRLVGLILGIIIAANLGSWASDILSLQFNWSRQITDIAGYVLIFLVVILVIQLAGFLLRSIIHAVKLGWLDRLGGLLFGVMKAAIVVSLLFWLLMAIPSDTLSKDIRERSFSYKLLGGFAPSLYEKLVQPYIRDGSVRNRLDSMLSPSPDDLSFIKEFEEELLGIEGVDQAFVDDLKLRFNELPLQKQMLIISKLSEKEPDLQEIINLLYAETP
ncbi:MAG: CvpA family protein [Candidatus Neomarinimicrobiota bacterium]|jgi:membrane protein required for colicin V production|nr:CvpA family protein [Candidatus Neomarinimicrobiota bacterium]